MAGIGNMAGKEKLSGFLACGRVLDRGSGWLTCSPLVRIA